MIEFKRNDYSFPSILTGLNETTTRHSPHIQRSLFSNQSASNFAHFSTHACDTNNNQTREHFKSK